MAGVRSLLLVIHAISAEVRCPCQLRRRLAKLMRWVSIEHLFSLGESIAEFVFSFLLLVGNIIVTLTANFG